MLPSPCVALGGPRAEGRGPTAVAQHRSVISALGATHFARQVGRHHERLLICKRRTEAPTGTCESIRQSRRFVPAHQDARPRHSSLVTRYSLLVRSISCSTSFNINDGCVVRHQWIAMIPKHSDFGSLLDRRGQTLQLVPQGSDRIVPEASQRLAPSFRGPDTQPSLERQTTI